MKILKYLLLFIIVLTLLFFGRGLLTPSIAYDAEVVVNKSAKEAWAVMNDVENLPKWIEGYKKSELVSGQLNTVGAVSNVYIQQGEEETMMTETIKAVTPNELLAMKFSMDFMDMDYEMSFKEKDGKTIIRSNSVTEGNGMFAKSMVAFMKGMMKSQEDENMKNLKKLIDGNTKNYFPEITSEATEQVME